MKGVFICRNCHFTLHSNISRVDKIYEDNKITEQVLKDYEHINRKFRENLITHNKSIKNPLNVKIKKYKSLYKNLEAIFEISKQKEFISSRELENWLGKSSSTIRNFFKTRKDILMVCGRIIKEWGKQTKYYLNSNGKNYIKLLFYFRDYYKNKRFL
ncbi:MAG: hypothetical protein BAJALOKI2v1_310029 [Promethearchaeota archaeon]|nr:MAG: hypothetical protein BAJALOKI2v1_310029 [Candidatus Lokiarchaeota archaeon]